MIIQYLNYIKLQSRDVHDSDDAEACADKQQLLHTHNSDAAPIHIR